MSYLKNRNCPQCNIELKYTNRSVYCTAKKRNSLCSSCSAKNRDNSQNFKKFNEDVKNGIKPVPFKNNTHTLESKQKMSVYHKLNSDIYKTDEFKQKMSLLTSGENNPMYGKTFYDIWLKKYGKEEADKKLIEFKNTQSINTSGNKNPMFGKPSPQGSGNGWKGWYKGIFFRSLLELSFLVKYIERFNMKMINAECKQYAIQYIDKNKIKTYFADYIINDKYLIEIKPKKLHLSYSVQLKANAASEYCKNNNLTYKLIEPIKLNKQEILFLIELGNLRFTEKYLEKVINY